MMQQLFIGELDCSKELIEVIKTAEWTYEVRVYKRRLYDYFYFLVGNAKWGIPLRGHYGEIVPNIFLLFNGIMLFGEGYSLDEIGNEIQLLADYDNYLFQFDFTFVTPHVNPEPLYLL